MRHFSILITGLLILCISGTVTAVQAGGQWRLTGIEHSDEAPNGVRSLASSGNGRTIQGQAQIGDGRFSVNWNSHHTQSNYRQSLSGVASWPAPPQTAEPGDSWRGTLTGKLLRAESRESLSFTLYFFISAHRYAPGASTETTELANLTVQKRYSTTGDKPINYVFPEYDGRRNQLRISAGGRTQPPGYDADVSIDYLYEWEEQETAQQQVDIEVKEVYASVFEARGTRGVELFEESADQHMVVTRLKNVGNNNAGPIEVTLWEGEPGDEGGRQLSSPVIIPTIATRRNQYVKLIWPLNGPVENVNIFVQARPMDCQDSTPANNVRAAAGPVSIWYAHNGERAYRFPEDAYSFGNYSTDTAGAEGMLEIWLARAARGMQTGAMEAEVLRRLIFPQTWTRFSRYVASMSSIGSRGHCYGIASTSALYFEDETLRPVDKITNRLSFHEASPNIASYQVAQLNDLFAILAGDDMVRGDHQSTFATVKRSLENNRTCLVHYFGPNWGHAVLAYKFVKVAGYNPIQCIYLYDPNYQPGHQRAKVTSFFAHDGSMIWLPYFTRYNRTFRRSTASPVRPDFVPESQRLILPVLRDMLKATTETINSGNQLIVLRCPANLTVRNSAGDDISAIAGAEIVSSGEVEIYTLPTGNEYNISIARTGDGDISLDLLQPDGDQISLTSFDALQLEADGDATLTISDDNQVSAIAIGDAVIEPNLKATFDGEEVSIIQADNLLLPQEQSATSTPISSELTPSLYRHRSGAYSFPLADGWSVVPESQDTTFDTIVSPDGSMTVHPTRARYALTQANGDAELDAYVEKVRRRRSNAIAKRMMMGGAEGVAVLHQREDRYIWNVLVVEGDYSYLISINVPVDGDPYLPAEIEYMLSNFTFSNP